MRVREAQALPQGEARDLLSPEREVLAQRVDVVRATALRVGERQPVRAVEAIEVLPRHVEQEHDLVSPLQEVLGGVAQKDAAAAPGRRVDLVGHEADGRHSLADPALERCPADAQAPSARNSSTERRARSL